MWQNRLFSPITQTVSFHRSVYACMKLSPDHFVNNVTTDMWQICKVYHEQTLFPQLLPIVQDYSKLCARSQEYHRVCLGDTIVWAIYTWNYTILTSLAIKFYHLCEKRWTMSQMISNTWIYNVLLYCSPIHHDIRYGTVVTVAESESDQRITMDVFWDDFAENWPRYNGTTLYGHFYRHVANNVEHSSKTLTSQWT